MSLQLNRPDDSGGLEKRPAGEDGDWRNHLVTPRWGAGLRKRRPPALANPEMNPTSMIMSVAFWVGLAALTFILVLIGYGSGFWH